MIRLLPVLGYTPFIDPLPIWSRDWIWAVWLLPLCLAVAIIYKTIKCQRVSQVPREALGLFITILLGMAVAAVALTGLVRWVQ